MRIQYCIYMSLSFLSFIVTSIALIPFAWVIGIVDKLRNLHIYHTHQEQFLNVYLFIPFGIPILLLDFIADIIYFWKNNFRVNLRKIIIEKERSKLNHRTLREFMTLCKSLTDRKIKSLKTDRLLNILKTNYKLMQNLQYLVFG